MDVDRLSGLTLYLTVFAIVFLESGVPFGFWLPGDAMLFAVGLLSASHTHHVSLFVVAVGVAVSGLAGGWLGYLTGRRLGRPWLERRHRRVLERTETFYARFGPVTLVAARFVPWARTFAPILAGAVRMPPGRFTLAAAVGAVLWGAGIPSLGRAASAIPVLKDASAWLAPGILALSVTAGVAGELARRRLRRRAPAVAVRPDAEGGAEPQPSASSAEPPAAAPLAAQRPGCG